MSRLLGSLQRPESLDFLAQGFVRLLGSRLASESTYVPASVSPIECEQVIACFIRLIACFIRLIAC